METEGQLLTAEPESKSRAVSSHDLAQVGHYINALGAFVLAGYLTFHGAYRALQYFQISFVSVLLLLLEKKHSKHHNILFAVFGLVVGTLWNILITILFYHDLHSTQKTLRILTPLATTSSFSLILSWVWYAYRSKPISVDIDLMLYFFAMNIIAFFSADQFNNTLHLLIDIRTYQLLFTATLSLKSKFDLLLSPQFIVINILMFVAYVLFSLAEDWSNCLGFTIYGAIGLIMFTVPIAE
jgi:hypothetical protein